MDSPSPTGGKTRRDEVTGRVANLHAIGVGEVGVLHQGDVGVGTLGGRACVFGDDVVVVANWGTEIKVGIAIFHVIHDQISNNILI